MRIILGSSSPSRMAIMRTIASDFEVMHPDVDEKAIRHPNASYLVMAIALAKSHALRDRIGEDAILVTADTVVLCNGVIREKPRDAAEAAAFLRTYRLQAARVVTGVVVYSGLNRSEAAAVDAAMVEFKLLGDEAIDRLCADPTAIAGAGGFVIMHPLWQPHIRRIQGTRSSAMGLPDRITRQLIDTVSKP